MSVLIFHMPIYIFVKVSLSHQHVDQVQDDSLFNICLSVFQPNSLCAGLEICMESLRGEGGYFISLIWHVLCMRCFRRDVVKEIHNVRCRCPQRGNCLNADRGGGSKSHVSLWQYDSSGSTLRWGEERNKWKCARTSCTCTHVHLCMHTHTHFTLNLQRL